jgi:hypothetical protein
MANLLISIVVAGLAVTFLLELLDKIQLGILLKSTVNTVASMPLSVGCLYALQRHWTVTMVVSVPAATFIALALNMFINKPTVVQQQRLPRIY